MVLLMNKYIHIIGLKNQLGGVIDFSIPGIYEGIYQVNMLELMGGCGTI